MSDKNSFLSDKYAVKIESSVEKHNPKKYFAAIKKRLNANKKRAKAIAKVSKV